MGCRLCFFLLGLFKYLQQDTWREDFGNKLRHPFNFQMLFIQPFPVLVTMAATFADWVITIYHLADVTLYLLVELHVGRAF